MVPAFTDPPPPAVGANGDTAADAPLTTGEIEAIGVSRDRLDLLDGRAARFLRAVAGCDEEVLRACPEERFKFSGFGAVIIGTSSMAAVSMTMALSIVFAAPLVATAPGGLLWGGFVLVLDRWLISTGRGWKHFLPRVVLAAFFGLIIAEPLVLLAFDDAISRDIADDAVLDLDAFRKRWTRCNPEIVDVDDLPEVPSSCDGYDLPVTRPTMTALRPLDAENSLLLAQLMTDIHNLENDRLRWEQQRAAEKAGEEGTGLSGQRGSGPLATSAQEKVDAITEQIDSRTDDLTELQTERNEAQATLDAYNTDVAERIDRKVSEQEEHLTKTPGLAQRMDALTGLMVESPTIGVARIVLTLFLVAIDTMPALVRSSSAGGAYDKIMALRQARSIESEHVRHTLVTEKRRTRERTERARIMHDAEALERKLDLDRQLDLARMDHQVETELVRVDRSSLDQT